MVASDCRCARVSLRFTILKVNWKHRPRTFYYYFINRSWVLFRLKTSVVIVFTLTRLWSCSSGRKCRMPSRKLSFNRSYCVSRPADASGCKSTGEVESRMRCRRRAAAPGTRRDSSPWQRQWASLLAWRKQNKTKKIVTPVCRDWQLNFYCRNQIQDSIDMHRVTGLHAITLVNASQSLMKVHEAAFQKTDGQIKKTKVFSTKDFFSTVDNHCWANTWFPQMAVRYNSQDSTLTIKKKSNSSICTMLLVRIVV